jgi:hypothetical protein
MLDIEGIKIKIAELETAINTAIPGYSGILKEIHTNLKDQPELLYRLEDEQIAVIISGLEKYHNVEIVAAKSDKEAKKVISKKQGSLLGADDV